MRDISTKKQPFMQLLPACSPHGRWCVPRDGSLQRQSVRSWSVWGLPAHTPAPRTAPRCAPCGRPRAGRLWQPCPVPHRPAAAGWCRGTSGYHHCSGPAISEREERKGKTQRSQKKRIYVQYTIRPDKKQPEYGAPAKSSGRANKRNSFRHRCAMPPIPLLALSCHLPRPGESFSRREALARRRSVPFCQRLPL